MPPRYTQEQWMAVLLDSLPSGTAETMARMLSDTDNVAGQQHNTILNGSDPQPGLGASGIVLGDALIGLEFSGPTDAAYRAFKISRSYTNDPKFHIHWTKSTDADESAKTVRWRIRYVVFNGSSQDVTAAPVELTFDDVYDDDGTTSRIVYRSVSLAATGFTAGYYVGMVVDVVAGGTNLTGNPVLISADLTYDAYINQAPVAF